MSRKKVQTREFRSIIIPAIFGYLLNMNRPLGKFAIPAAACAVAAAVAVCRSSLSAEAMPQKNDADPIAILFGDVRMLIGRQMVGKADEYFHGGVTDLDCSLDHSHRESDGHMADEADDETEGHHHHHHHDDDVYDAEGGDSDGNREGAVVRAPWAFVTRTIRLPSVERHLEGESSREILPWLWAACRVDSGNISAYANAAYVLESLYGDAEKALAVLDEGIRANPQSSELEFQKGMLLLHRLAAPERAEAAFRAALAKVTEDRALENRDDTDATLIAIRILSFLGKLAADRGEDAEVRRCYKAALEIAPEHSVTKTLGKLVNQQQE